MNCLTRAASQSPQFSSSDFSEPKKTKKKTPWKVAGKTYDEFGLEPFPSCDGPVIISQPNDRDLLKFWQFMEQQAINNPYAYMQNPAQITVDKRFLSQRCDKIIKTQREDFDKMLPEERVQTVAPFVKDSIEKIEDENAVKQLLELSQLPSPERTSSERPIIFPIFPKVTGTSFHMEQAEKEFGLLGRLPKNKLRAPKVKILELNQSPY